MSSSEMVDSPSFPEPRHIDASPIEPTVTSRILLPRAARVVSVGDGAGDRLVDDIERSIPGSEVARLLVEHGACMNRATAGSAVQHELVADTGPARRSACGEIVGRQRRAAVAPRSAR